MKWLGQHIVSLIARFRSSVYFENVENGATDTDKFLVIGSSGKLKYRTGTEVLSDIGGSSTVGDITSVVAGTGLSGGATSGAATLNVDASQTQITSIGTIGTGEWRGTVIDSNYMTSGTDSVRGIVELATTAETTTGTSTTLVVTPDGLKDGYQGSANISTVGTITTGTWRGTAMELESGGTGLVGATDGKIVIADGSGAPVLLDVGSSTAIETLGTIGTGVWQGDAIETAYIADDAITEDKLANTLLAEIDANTAKATNVTTNLTATTHASQITINSSDGTNVVVAEASGSIAGVMTVAHHDKLDAIEASATADQSKSDIDELAITTVGTVDTGVWQGTPITQAYINADQRSITTLGTIEAGIWNGTAIASAYLDADTAHLSGSQTFTGTKTLNSFKGTGGATVTNILDEDAMGSNSATALATQQSIKAYADTKVSKDTTRQLTHHMIVDDIGTGVIYISLGQIDAENATASNKNLPLLAPVAGKLLKVFLRTTQDMSAAGSYDCNLTWRLYTRTTSQSTNGNAAEVGAKTGAGPTNKTMVTYDFTTGVTGTNAIAVGDKVLLSVQSDAASTDISYFITCLWEWDLS